MPSQEVMCMAISEPVWFSGRFSNGLTPAGSDGFGHADLLFGADSPSSSKDPDLVAGNSPIWSGSACATGQGGTRGGSSILEFAVENHPNNASPSNPDLVGGNSPVMGGIAWATGEGGTRG